MTFYTSNMKPREQDIAYVHAFHCYFHHFDPFCERNKNSEHGLTHTLMLMLFLARCSLCNENGVMLDSNIWIWSQISFLFIIAKDLAPCGLRLA